jgi:hypothetical protein
VVGADVVGCIGGGRRSGLEWWRVGYVVVVFYGFGCYDQGLTVGSIG